MFLEQWVECSSILGVGSGTVYTVPYGVMAQPFTGSTAARKRLYLRDVSLRPKTDHNTVRLLVLFHASKTTGTNSTSNLI